SASASMIDSRPVEGVRMRYFWCILMVGHATSGPDRKGSRPSAPRRNAHGAMMPRAWIECAPEHGESPRTTASKPCSTDPKRVAGGRAGGLCDQAPHG